MYRCPSIWRESRSFRLGKQQSGSKAVVVPEAKPSGMRIFYRYEGKRYTIDVPEGKKVEWVKAQIKAEHGLREVSSLEKPVLTLLYAGSDLKDDWIFSDLGISHGHTINVGSRYIARPCLFVYCMYNGDTINIIEEDPKFLLCTVAHLRSYISRKTGMPVGVFRLISPQGDEMFDMHSLDRYGVKHASHITLESWDGWNDYLNLATLGVISHIQQQLSGNDAVARFQMRVALYIAAHFGHVNLAASMLKRGTRPDEPVGLHPSRQWCSGDEHPDRVRAPVHEATEFGRLDILRILVSNSVGAMFATDARGRMPLNIALQSQQRPCARFLLSKQFSRVSVTSTESISLMLFARLLDWANTARETVYMRGGFKKTTAKWKTAPQRKVLVGLNKVLVDGFGNNSRTSRKSPLHKIEFEDFQRRRQEVGSVLGHNAEPYFRSMLRSGKQRQALHRQPSIASRKVSVNETLKTGPSLPPLNLPPASSPSVAESSAAPDDEAKFVTKLHGVETMVRRKSTAALTAPSVSDFQLPVARAAPPTRQSVGSAIRNARERNQVISLPMKSAQITPRPFHRSKSSTICDPIAGTIPQFEHYQGAACRRSALERLSIAHSFKKKPWLQQVRIALNVSERSVRRPRFRQRSMTVL